MNMVEECLATYVVASIIFKKFALISYLHNIYINI